MASFQEAEASVSSSNIQLSIRRDYNGQLHFNAITLSDISIGYIKFSELYI